MSYEKLNEEVKTQKGAPIKITPLAEDFKENLYVLYELYRPDQQNTNHLGDYMQHGYRE